MMKRKCLLLFLFLLLINATKAQENVVNDLKNLCIKNFIELKVPRLVNSGIIKCAYRESWMAYDFELQPDLYQWKIFKEKTHFRNKCLRYDEDGWSYPCKIKGHTGRSHYIDAFRFFLLQDTLICEAIIKTKCDQQHYCFTHNIKLYATLAEDGRWHCAEYNREVEKSFSLGPEKSIANEVSIFGCLDQCLWLVKSYLIEAKESHIHKIFLLEDFFPDFFCLFNKHGFFDKHIPRGDKCMNYKEDADCFVGYPKIMFDGSRMIVSVSCIESKKMNKKRLPKLIEENRFSLIYRYNRDKKTWEEEEFVIPEIWKTNVYQDSTTSTKESN